MENLKKDYLIIVVDPEEDEVVGIFIAPEDKFPPMNMMQPPGMDPMQPEVEVPEPEDGPELYYPQDRELVRELRRKAMERERKKRRSRARTAEAGASRAPRTEVERMLKWMMEK